MNNHNIQNLWNY